MPQNDRDVQSSWYRHSLQQRRAITVYKMTVSWLPGMLEIYSSCIVLVFAREIIFVRTEASC